MQELWFLCITRRFNVLYKCMKIRLSYQVIEWTLFCDGQTDRPTDRHKWGTIRLATLPGGRHTYVKQ